MINFFIVNLRAPLSVIVGDMAIMTPGDDMLVLFLHRALLGRIVCAIRQTYQVSQ